jgi:hypothetical protein
MGLVQIPVERVVLPAVRVVIAHQLWPALLEVASKNKRTVLKMESTTRTDVAEAFARELAAVKIEGQELTFDWPVAKAIDNSLQNMLIGAKPASLSYSFAGEDREPICPAPVSFRTEGDHFICELNSESGKPVELVRAMQRHLPTQDLTDKKVDMLIQGEGVVSRIPRA